MEWTFELLWHNPRQTVTEGNLWMGDHLLFSDIRGSRILRYDPGTGEVSVWRDGTRHTNGLACDRQGRVYGCSSGGRSIVRFEADGSTTIVADRLDGKRLNTPNDLVVDAQGRVWFTDPWNPGSGEPGAVQELSHCSVLRADPRPDGGYELRRVVDNVEKPNGILLSADERILYVAESDYVPTVPRELRAYPIGADGSLGMHDVLFSWGADHRGCHRGIDGMRLDVEGNIVACVGWAAAGAGPLVQVMSPLGRVLETHRVPVDKPTNCCFGGPDLSTLFLTTGEGHLFKAETERKGHPVAPMNGAWRPAHRQ